jgi:ABC-type arginine transport system ATPase subunit
MLEHEASRQQQRVAIVRALAMVNPWERVAALVNSS